MQTEPSLRQKQQQLGLHSELQYQLAVVDHTHTL
jgi:hypothetical protein